ncbi:MAG: YdcF family protein [Thermoflexales bacterium]|nr:YdcF family protein [Thermoflexales bacterium]
MKLKRVRRLLLFLLPPIGIALISVLVIIDQYGYVDQTQPADVIIVLGAQVTGDGQPGTSLARRAAHAASLYQQGYADFVLCSGGVGDNPPSEARAACGRVMELGVPPEAIVYEENASSTEENAAFSAQIMRARGWRSAILATDGFHLFRAAWMFQRTGLTVYPSPAQITAGPMDTVERLGRELREVLGLAWYGARVVLNADVTKP